MMPSQSDDQKEQTGRGTEIRGPQGGTQPKLDSDQELLSSGSLSGDEAESPEVAPERPETVVGLSTARIEMFCDSVFAIVSTLLVLQIQVPRIPPGDVAESLPRATLAMWPEFPSYAASFVSVDIYWILRHFMFHYIRRSDRFRLSLNLLFLMFVSFPPFPTALIGADGRQPVVVMIYGLTLAAIGFILFLIWVYATSEHKIVDPKIDALMVRSTIWKTLIPSMLYLLAVNALARHHDPQHDDLRVGTHNQHSAGADRPRARDAGTRIRESNSEWIVGDECRYWLNVRPRHESRLVGSQKNDLGSLY